MRATSNKAEELQRRIRTLEKALASKDEELASKDEELASKNEELASKNEEIRSKAVSIAYLQRMLFGRKSERLTKEELGQLVLALGGSQSDADATEPLIPVPESSDVEPEETERRKKRRPNHPGRTRLSEDLERIITEVNVPSSEQACHQCGETMPVFGHVDHERVEYIPAKLVVHVERREKRGCKRCQKDAVTAESDENKEHSSPLRVGPSLLAHLIESKCDDSQPIHRQCDQLSRLGFELPTSTAYGYWRYATNLLSPLADALLGLLLEDPNWVGIDDTGLDVLDKTKPGGKYRGHLWCFRASSGFVAYRFTETWEAQEVAPWFGLLGKDTHAQVDDYKGYSALVDDGLGGKRIVCPPERRLGCMMHVRRRFFDALKAGDKRAAQPVQWIQKIYKVEESARGRPPDERLAMREEHSLVHLDAFDKWVDEQVNMLGKTGKLAKAVRYAKQQRVFVRRCFADGRFEIDNGATEREIRKPAIGRKNFLFSGSAKAAQRLAVAYSLVQTCRNLGISTREYLVDVISKIEAGWPARRLTELLPHRWAEKRLTR